MARRHALLIGITDYEKDYRPLAAPEEDVRAFAQVLADPTIGGFEQPIVLPNPSLLDARDAVEDLFAGAGADDLILFYYSGHGDLDYEGRLHFVLPETTRQRLASRSLDAGFVRDRMRSCYARSQVAILDCCYAASFDSQSSRGSVHKALTEQTFGEGRFVIASAAETQVASEPEQDQPGRLLPSKFTEALVGGLRTGGGREDQEFTTVLSLFQHVSQSVQATSRQSPQLLSRGADIRLARNPAYLAQLPRQLQEALDDMHRDKPRRLRLGAVTDLRHELLVQPVEGLNRAIVHRVVQALKTFRNDDLLTFRAAVLSLLGDLEKEYGDHPPNPAASAGTMFRDLPDPWPAGKVFRDLDEPWCPEMVVIPGGTFVMGSPEDEPERRDNEGPQHEVEVPRFALGIYAVTFAEYDHFCEATGREKPWDQNWGRADRPVINVSWGEASAYCEWLSGAVGCEYRLPSEAEWEYAARAGSTTPFWWGWTITPAQASYDSREAYNGGETGKYREQTVPVRSFDPNPFGLYQVHGNVLEWVQDDYHDSYEGAPSDGSAWSGDDGTKVLRGGSWDVIAQVLRSAIRSGVVPDFRFDFIGFRVSRTLTP